MPKSTSRTAVATGKQLLRDLTQYAQRVSKEDGVPFIDAVAIMRDNAEEVARDIGVSSVFVTLWAETALRQAGR
jgi:hypothetical protein